MTMSFDDDDSPVFPFTPLWRRICGVDQMSQHWPQCRQTHRQWPMCEPVSKALSVASR